MLLLRMEIALPHTISQTKASLSTFASFPSIKKKKSKRNCMAGEMNTFSLSDKEAEFHTNTSAAVQLILSRSQCLSLKISLTIISSRSITPI